MCRYIFRKIANKLGSYAWLKLYEMYEDYINALNEKSYTRERYLGEKLEGFINSLAFNIIEELKRAENKSPDSLGYVSLLEEVLSTSDLMTKMYKIDRFKDSMHRGASELEIFSSEPPEKMREIFGYISGRKNKDESFEEYMERKKAGEEEYKNRSEE